MLTELKTLEAKMKSFQSIFFHAPFEAEPKSEHGYLDDQDPFWKVLYNVLKENGVLWCCANNSLREGSLDVSPLQLATDLQTLGFYTRNVILWYNLEYANCSSHFGNRYSYILFLVKDADHYKFNIDVVREPHIWKEFEWGGGRRSRYHPLGKNPSNFWLRTISEHGKTLNHVPLSWKEMVRRCLQSCTESGDDVLGIVPKKGDFESVCKDLGLNFNLIQLHAEDFHPSSVKRSYLRTDLNRAAGIAPRVYYKSSESMSEVSAGEVQVVVTSPPYWGLRDYGVTDQIGFKESYSTYLSRLETVWAECYRVLHNTGTLWININKRWLDGKILLFPVDIIRSCMKIGFTLRDIVMWFRAISVPGTGQRNFTDRYEFIMMFSKSDEIKFHEDRTRKRDFLNEDRGNLINVWKLYRRIGNLNRDAGYRAKLAIKHTAMFPDELVSRVVSLCSDEGEVVLDPFLGSGTTVAVAESLNRRGVGYEINEAFRPLIDARVNSNSQSLKRFLK